MTEAGQLHLARGNRRRERRNQHTRQIPTVQELRFTVKKAKCAAKKVNWRNEMAKCAMCQSDIVYK